MYEEEEEEEEEKEVEDSRFMGADAIIPLGLWCCCGGDSCCSCWNSFSS